MLNSVSGVAHPSRGSSQPAQEPTDKVEPIKVERLPAASPRARVAPQCLTAATRLSQCSLARRIRFFNYVGVQPRMLVNALANYLHQIRMWQTNSSPLRSATRCPE